MLFFFFLMIRRPPRSTLFPTRRSSDLYVCRYREPRRSTRCRRRPRETSIALRERARSEEHTSELQSQSNLVCRLLLEKKTTETPILNLIVTRIHNARANLIFVCVFSLL